MACNGPPATRADVSAQLNSIGSGGATFDTNGNNVTFATALGGTGGLTKAGTGTLTLSGANFYSGATTVNTGTLQLAVVAALPVGGALAINGGTFATNGNVGVGALSGTGGTINLVSGTLTANSSSNTTLAATITGAGGFSKAGSGTLNLTGANTYTGGTAGIGATNHRQCRQALLRHIARWPSPARRRANNTIEGAGNCLITAGQQAAQRRWQQTSRNQR